MDLKALNLTKALFFLLILLLPSTTSAATYYISKSGNDTTGNGSSTTPWLTMNKANITATHGDTVHVGPGIYEENYGGGGYLQSLRRIQWIADGEVIVKSASTTSDAIRIRDVGGAGQPYSFTGFTFNGASNTLDVALLDAVSNVTFENCKFENNNARIFRDSGLSSNISIISSTFSNTSTQQRMFDFGAINNFSVSSSVFNFPNGFSSAFMLFNNATTGTLFLQNNTFNVNLSGATLTIGGKMSAQIIGNTFNIANPGYFIYSGAGTTGTGAVLIKNNTFNLSDGMAGSLISMVSGTHPIVIENNFFTDNSSTDYSDVLNDYYNFIQIINQPTPIITNNTFETLADPGAAVSAIRIESTGFDIGAAQIKNNIIRTAHRGGYGIAVGSEGSTAGDDKISGTAIEGNQLYGPLYYDSSAITTSLHGLFVGFNKNALFKKNYVNGAGYGVAYKGNNTDGTGGGIFQNIFYNSGATSYVRLKGVNSTTVANNVFYSDGSFTAALGLLSVGQNDVGSYNAEHNTIRNNIFSRIGSTQFIQIADTGSALGFSSNNNLFWGDGSYGLDFRNITPSVDFATWQSSGYDTNSKLGDPHFNNLSNLDFSISEPSAALDLGVNTGLSVDYNGNSFYNNPDAGAYEIIPSKTIGVNAIYQADSLKIYSDGKFVYLSPTTTIINFSATPANGIFPGGQNDWLNISNLSWGLTGNRIKSFIASSSIATTTIFNIGDLLPATYYTVSVNGSSTATLQSSPTGSLIFTYSGGFSSHDFNFSPETTNPSSFHLISPTNNSTHASQPTPTFTTSTDVSGISKYQLYLDNALNTDNISSSTTSSPFSGTLACGNHNWFVKAFDNLNNLTTSTENWSFTINCPSTPVSSGGGGSSSFLPGYSAAPTAPGGGFKIIINNGNQTTNNRSVSLQLTAGFDTKNMAISEDPNFKNSTQETFTKEKIWNLSPGNGQKNIYVKFFTTFGVSSDVFSDSIVLNSIASEKETTSTTNIDSVETGSNLKENQTTKPALNISLKMIKFKRDLRPGATGQEVKNLQTFLKKQGKTIYPEGRINGRYDYATIIAIKRFQTRNKIKSNGLFGPQTRAKINTLLTNK